MSNAKPIKSNRSRRQSGSSMAEASAMSVVLMIVAVPLLAFFVNVSFQLLYQNRLSSVASNVAIYASQQSTWLGLPRPNRQDKVANLDDVATAMCSKLGIQSAAAKITIVPSDQIAITPADQSEIYVCDLTANVLAPFRFSILGFDLGRFLPGAVSVRGIATAPISQPYSVVKFDGQGIDPADPNKALADQQRTISYLPCYGFTREGEALPVGNLGLPPKGLVADNTLAINTWPTDRQALQKLGVRFKPNVDMNDGKSLNQIYFHQDSFGSGNK